MLAKRRHRSFVNVDKKRIPIEYNTNNTKYVAAHYSRDKKEKREILI